MNLTHRRPWLLAVALLSFAVCPTPAHAQTQAAMNREAHASFQKADARLNSLYAKVLASVDDEGKEKLKAAQRAWVAFRDAEAALRADEARGGTMAPLLYENAREELTEARIKQLRSLLEPSDR
jgi:uncharacterized protein YecT (DUF1311 family)